MLARASKPGTLSAEFAEFLEESGLGSLRKLTVEKAITFSEALIRKRATSSSPGRFGYKDDFRKDIRALSQSVLSAAQRADTGTLEDAVVHDSYGKVAIMDGAWKRSFGLLYDGSDHRTEFLNRDKPLDICVRLQAEPSGLSPASLDAWRSRFDGLRRDLDFIGFDCDPNNGSWKGNRHTILLGQFRAGFPWQAVTGGEQSRLVADIFRQTWAILDNESHLAQIRALPSYE